MTSPLPITPTAEAAEPPRPAKLYQSSSDLVLLDAGEHIVEGAPKLWVEYDYDTGSYGEAPSLYSPGEPSQRPCYWPVAINGERVQEGWQFDLPDGDWIGYNSICLALDDIDPEGVMCDEWGHR